jgi:hypothetical protein
MKVCVLWSCLSTAVNFVNTGTSISFPLARQFFEFSALEPLKKTTFSMVIRVFHS